MLTAKDAPAAPHPERHRNRRGQGDRLRAEILDAASAILAESPHPTELTLRAVARRAGIATTSIYLHFDDIEHLTSAVAERHFADLARAIGRADVRTRTTDPVASLVAGCTAYCRFGLRHPGAYRVLFDSARPDLDSNTEQSSGRRLLDGLAAAIERCHQPGAVPPKVKSDRLALVLWAALHGVVSLRLSRQGFPWPPLDDLLKDLVGRLLCGAS